jgi:hypothetical protein
MNFGNISGDTPMGGFGSGRKSGGSGPVVDDALVLDIDQLKRRGELEASSSGRWAWVSRPSGKAVYERANGVAYPCWS